MLVPLKNIAGEQVGEIELSDAVFAAAVSKPLMHQALVRQLANARLGTHDTKERWEVSGGGKKPWKQKGTGRARQGSTRASQFIGGGTAFGPTPRKYTQALPKKMQRAALRSALTIKAAAGQLVVVDEVVVDEAKTKTMVRILNAVGANQGSVLMVLGEKSDLVWRSAHNLPNVKTLISGYLNVRDLLGYDTLMLSKDAVEQIELWLGLDGPAPVSTPDDGEEAAAGMLTPTVSASPQAEVEEESAAIAETAPSQPVAVEEAAQTSEDEAVVLDADPETTAKAEG